MSKKITITLTDEAEEYFNEVQHSLDDGNGKVATQSQVINHCLMELSVFEVMTETDVTGYIRDNGYIKKQ